MIFNIYIYYCFSLIGVPCDSEHSLVLKTFELEINNKKKRLKAVMEKKNIKATVKIPKETFLSLAQSFGFERTYERLGFKALKKHCSVGPHGNGFNLVFSLYDQNTSQILFKRGHNLQS